MDDNHGAAVDAVLEALTAKAQSKGTLQRGEAEAVLCLAEAYAWLVNPNQPHGSHTHVSKT